MEENNATLNDLYLKYAENIGGELESDKYFRYLFTMIRAGENEINQTNQILRKVVDERWLSTIEEALDSINKIIENPRRMLKTNEEVVPVSLAKRISSESVRHLSQNTQLIASAEDGEVNPIKILNVTVEDTYDLYENRFIYHLIQRLVRFIDKRTDVIFWSTGDEKRNKLTFSSHVDDAYEQIDYKIEMTIKNLQSFAENDSDNMNVFMRIDRVRRMTMALKNSAFCELMHGCQQVRSPIQRTNLLMKDRDYRICYKLWQFLETYEEVGYSINVEESTLQFDEEYLFQLYSNFIMNYAVFKSILEPDHRELTKELWKHHRQRIPKFIKKIEEMKVDDPDLPDVEIRRVFIEEVTQAQLEAEARYEEEKQARIEAENAKADAEARAAQAENRALDAEAAAVSAQLEKQSAIEKAEAEKTEGIRKAEEEKQSAIEKAEAEKTEGIRKAEEEKQAAIEKAEAEKTEGIKKAEEERDRTVADITAASKAEVAAAVKEKDETIARLNAEHEAEMARFVRERDESMAVLNAEHEESMTQLREEKDADITRIEKEHAAGTARLNEKHEASVAKLNEEHETNVAKLKEEYAANVAKLNAEHETSVAKLNEKLAASVSEFNAKITGIRQESDSDIAGYKELAASESEKAKVADKLRAATSKELDRMTKARDSVQEELSKALKNIQKLNDTVDGLNAAQQELLERISAQEQENVGLKETIDAQRPLRELQRELDEANAARAEDSAGYDMKLAQLEASIEELTSRLEEKTRELDESEANRRELGRELSREMNDTSLSGYIGRVLGRRK